MSCHDCDVNCTVKGSPDARQKVDDHIGRFIHSHCCQTGASSRYEDATHCLSTEGLNAVSNAMQSLQRHLDDPHRQLHVLSKTSLEEYVHFVASVFMLANGVLQPEGSNLDVSGAIGNGGGAAGVVLLLHAAELEAHVQSVHALHSRLAGCSLVLVAAPHTEISNRIPVFLCRQTDHFGTSCFVNNSWAHCMNMNMRGFRPLHTSLL